MTAVIKFQKGTIITTLIVHDIINVHANETTLTFNKVGSSKTYTYHQLKEYNLYDYD